MKIIPLLALSLMTASAFANPLKEFRNECRNSIVTVDEIVKDSHIKGHVQGLPTDAYEKFKVVFYVKTNRWYVHPYTYYENQEEGYSYSNLNENGEFQVKSVKRAVPAKELAVVVVPKSYKINDQRWTLRPIFGIFGGVLKNECNHTIVKGNGDFFM
jgi:hypothetical protein